MRCSAWRAHLSTRRAMPCAHLLGCRRGGALLGGDGSLIGAAAPNHRVRRARGGPQGLGRQPAATHRGRACAETVRERHHFGRVMGGRLWKTVIGSTVAGVAGVDGSCGIRDVERCCCYHPKYRTEARAAGRRSAEQCARLRPALAGADQLLLAGRTVVDGNGMCGRGFAAFLGGWARRMEAMCWVFISGALPR